MEFEFRRDVSGELTAIFSMGSEAIAAWLLEEVGCQTSVMDEIFRAIRQLRSDERQEYLLKGSEYILRLDRESAEISDVRINFDADERIEGIESDGLNFYDEEAHASCGLDDFEEMLIEWGRFTAH